MRKETSLKWVLIVGVFLIIVGGRILRLSLDDKELHVDEVWSVWQLMGTHKNYSLDTNWPPLYIIGLDVWKEVAGIHPVALRFYSVMLFVLGAAFTCRALKRLRNESAGLLGILAYGAVALGLFFTTEVRANALIFSLMPLAFWLTIRYFDRPNWRRGLVLAFSLAAMFYTAFTAFGAFLILGLYTLIHYPRKIWRWWLPGVIAALIAAPEISRIAGLATGRIAATGQITLGSFFPAILHLYEQYAGYSFLPWAVLFALASVLIFLRSAKKPWGLLIWALSPALLYILNPILGFFSPTYGWFIVPGVMLWIAWGLSLLPRLGQLAAGVALSLILVTPISYDNYQAAGAPIGRSFAWLAQHIQWGDVVTIDPMWRDEFCSYPRCINAEMWDYLIRLYFPQGLQVVDEPGNYRRVWYLKWDGEGWHDNEFEMQVRENRVESIFVGPYKALFRLYEAPPDSEGVLFENGMRFHGMDVVGESPRPLVRREGDSLRLRLWWSVDQGIEADYSIALHIYRRTSLAAQSDSGPQLIDPAQPPQTSAWEPGQYYIEERELTLPGFMPSEQYPIYLTVYQWWDGQRVNAPGVNADSLLDIGKLYIKAW